MTHKNYFHKILDEELLPLGGLFNAHSHIDRFATADPKYFSKPNDPKKLAVIRLWDKQSSLALLHGGLAYQKESLEDRISRFLKISAQTGLRRVDSFIDVSESIPFGRGMGAVNIARQLKKEYAELLDFRIGAYAPFGFRSDLPQTWKLFTEATAQADFIATSPERDDPLFYGADRAHIGLPEHFARTLALALKLNKPVHYHLDQQVDPRESGTEKLLDAIEMSPYREEIIKKGTQEPFIWAVHVISPSTYSRDRLASLLERLAKFKVGIICCPSAAISMTKLSFIEAPLNKGVAEILLMLKHKIHVRLGTDNVDDIFLPANSLDLKNEISFL